MSFVEKLAELAAELWRCEEEEREKRQKRTGKQEKAYDMRQAMYRALDMKGVRDLDERRKLLKPMGTILADHRWRKAASDKRKAEIEAAKPKQIEFWPESKD